MAAEQIEDLKIDLAKLSNSHIEKKYNLLSGKGSVDDQLRRLVDSDLVKNLSSSTLLQKKIAEEFKQILADRDQMRNEILKNGEDVIHLPINIPRLLFQCKQIFDTATDIGQVKQFKSDLNPNYVID